MNENIDLTKILKDCPIGWEFYSSIYGYVTFYRIEKGSEYPVKFFYINKNNSKKYGGVTEQGLYVSYFNGECTLFPSKDQRDWSKFTAPWYKKERDTIALLEKQCEQKKQVHFPKFTFNDVLALQCCMETVKKVQEDKELYNQLNLIHNKIYDAYWLGKQDEISLIISNSSNIGKDEQKPADKIEPKFKVGDWIITPKNEVLQITSIEGTSYRFNNKSHYWEICCCDEQCRFWTIQDAKDGDVIHLGAVTAIFKKYISQEKCICYCSFCKEEGFEIPIENGEDNVYGCYNATPATKEQRDSFMKVINDAGYEWDIEKKELNKKKKFDPKTLKPFDKVLVRRGSENYNVWFPDFVSDPPNDTNDKTLCMCIMEDITMVIPYNDETKNLIGTTYDAPEYYRYWED